MSKLWEELQQDRDRQLIIPAQRQIPSPALLRQNRKGIDPSGTGLLTPVWTVWTPIKIRTYLRGTCSPGVRCWWNALKLFGNFSLCKVSFTQQKKIKGQQHAGQPCGMLSGCSCRQTLLSAASEMISETGDWKVPTRCWPWFGHFSLWCWPPFSTHVAVPVVGVSC